MKKTMKKIKFLAVVLVVFLCLFGAVAGCDEPDSQTENSQGEDSRTGEEQDAVTSITLTKYNNTTISGNTVTVNLSDGPLTFTADVKTTGNASKDFKLGTSAGKIASVSGKTVKLLAPGEAKITATAAGDSTKKHAITLRIEGGTYSGTGITLTKYNETPISGNTVTVNLSDGPLTFTAVSGGEPAEFTLTSSDQTVATVSGKTVTLLKAGTTTITGTLAADQTQTHAITLAVTETTQGNGSVTGIKLRYNTITGDSFTVYMTASPMTFTADVQTTGGASADFSLASSNTGVATVSGKTVTLVAAGTTTITGTAAGDSTKKHAVTLTVENTPSASSAPSPYYITNNYDQDSSAGLLVQWHNNSSQATQKLQIVPASVDFGKAATITVTGKEFKGTTNTTGNFAARNVFRAQVTGLSPNTQYKYQVGDTGSWSDTYNHLTSSGNDDSFNFTVVSDPQSGAHAEMRATLLAADAFDPNSRFYLMAGDLVDEIGKVPAEIVSYTNVASEFNKNRPIIATQGNHDTYFNNGTDNQYRFGEATVFNAFITFPDNGWDTNSDKANRSQSYYFYYNKVLIVVLNTMATSNNAGTSAPNHTAQATWLKNLLENDIANNLSNYRIVVTHVSLLSGRSSERYLTPEARAAYGKICTDNKVDIYFAGHDHVYGRSNPIKLVGTTTSTAAIANQNFNVTAGGTIFSIVSATGPKFYTIDSPNDVAKWFPVKTDASSPGVYVNVKVTAAKLIVTAKRLDGTTLDTYEVPVK